VVLFRLANGGSAGDAPFNEAKWRRLGYGILALIVQVAADADLEYAGPRVMPVEEQMACPRSQQVT
jgi:hypothetical protein